MQNRSKQNTLWLLAALAAPLAHYSGSGWLTAAAAALAILPLSMIPKSWEDISKPIALAQILWLGAVAGALLTNSAAYWPSDNALAVPLTLLVLAALTNAAAAPRIGAVLSLLMVLLAVPAAVSGAAKAEPAWLMPTGSPWPWALSLALLLPNLPAGMGRRGVGLAALLSAALSLLVQGTICAQVASSVPDPFYQTARTLGMEPVIASAITLGWYSTAAYLLQSARKVSNAAGLGERWATVLVSGTAAGCILLGVQPDGPIWAILSMVLWVFTPFWTKIKKVEKT